MKPDRKLVRIARNSALGVLTTILVGCGLSCSRNTRPSFLLIVVDTMRADHLGSYGYTAAHTPVMDALADTGLRFAQGMTPAPVTLPAVSSILTGRYPFHHSVRDNDQRRLPGAETTLAELFSHQGYRTGAVVASAVLAADWGLSQGFEHYDDGFAGPYPIYNPALAVFAEDFAQDRRRADTVTKRTADLIKSFGRAPFFVMAHYFDPHSYYDPPPRHDRGHAYDGEISFVDEQIGLLLESLPDPENTLVVLVADHGEGLHEHGESEHGFLLYQTTVHVPIIVRGPGVPAGEVVTDPVSLVDVFPTVASWFALPPPDSRLDGQVWDIRTGAVPDNRDLYAETMRPLLSYHWSELRTLRRGSWKWISGDPQELYDVGNDPQEQKDLLASSSGTPLTGQTPALELAASLTALTGGETRKDVLASRVPVDPSAEKP